MCASFFKILFVPFDFLFIVFRNNVNFDGENNIECTPLFYAAEKGTPEVVKALLKKGRNP